MDYQVLKEELTLSAYTGKTNQEAADILNTLTVSIPRTGISAGELWENTVQSELDALSANAKQKYGWLLTLGTIDVGVGTNSRATLAALFGAVTTTRANLLALLAKTTLMSRALQLGLPFIGSHHVGVARG